jgi:hypothetical protein
MVDEVITGGCGVIAKTSDFVAVPARLEAERTTVAFPAAVGVPVIVPFVVWSVSPAGSPLAPKDFGALSAVMR